jgi:shikimate dehydrogenase
MIFTLGLLGYPLEHSISPAIHQAALNALGLPGEYVLYPVSPEPGGSGAIADLLARVRTGQIAGLNVTIPHKLAVLSMLDELTPAAQMIGAVNTIALRENRLVGENTDAPGFLADLENMLGTTASQGIALVLGAGGSGRAVIYSLLAQGWRVMIAARKPRQALQLTGDFERRMGKAPFLVTRLAAETLASLVDAPDQVSLVVNATPLGMSPHPDASPWPDGLSFPPGAFIYDLVYNPPETALVRDARKAGLAACNGLGMLVRQAALAFEIWTGQAAPLEAMLQAAQSAL